jgi:hypothetical protein
MNTKSADLWIRANDSLENLKRLSKMLTELKRVTRHHKAFSAVLSSEVMALAATLKQIQIVEEH